MNDDTNPKLNLIYMMNVYSNSYSNIHAFYVFGIK